MLSSFLNSPISLQMNLVFALRILLAGLCGFFLGIERSRRFKEAGVRTHMIVCCAATLMMIISKYGFADPIIFNGEVINGTKMSDPARIAAQVISGISFLGAGMIFKNGGSVTGLTTAAGIWATAGIGLALGSGMYFLGVICTVVISLIQKLMHIVTVGADAYKSCNIDILAENTEGFQNTFNDLIRQYDAVVLECRITREDNLVRYNATLKSKATISADDVNKRLSENATIREVAVISI